MSDRQILPEQLAALTQIFPNDYDEEEVQTIADLLGVDLDNIDVRVEFSDRKFQAAYSSCKYKVTAQLAYLKFIQNKLWASALKNNNTGNGLRGTKILSSLIEEFTSFLLWVCDSGYNLADITIIDVGSGCCHLLQRLALVFNQCSVIGIDIDQCLRHLLPWKLWEQMRNELDDVASHCSGKPSNRQLRAHFDRGLGVYKDGKPLIDSEIGLVYAKDWNAFATALELPKKNVVALFSFCAGIPDDDDDNKPEEAVMTELVRLITSKSSKVKFASLGDVHTRYGKFAYVQSTYEVNKEEPLWNDQCILKDFAKFSVSMGGSGERKSVTQFILNDLDTIIEHSAYKEIIDNIRNRKRVFINAVGMRIKSTKIRIVPWEDVRKIIKYVITQEGDPTRWNISVEMVKRAYQILVKETHVRREAFKLMRFGERVKTVVNDVTSYNYRTPQLKVHDMKYAGILFNISGNANTRGLQDYFDQETDSVLSALKWYLCKDEPGLPETQNIIQYLLQQSSYTIGEITGIIMKALKYYHKTRGREKYNARGVFTPNWNSFVHMNSVDVQNFERKIENDITWRCKAYGKCRYGLGQFIKSNKAVNRHIKQDQMEFFIEFREFIQVRLGIDVESLSSDAMKRLQKVLRIDNIEENDLNIKNFKRAIENEEDWVSEYVQVVSEEHSRSAKKARRQRSSIEVHRVLLSRYIASISEAAHLRLVESENYSEDTQDGGEYNDILKNRKIKKEKRKVKKHIVNVNGIDFVVDKQTMYQIRCASKELEKVMEAGDIPDISVKIDGLEGKGIDYSAVNLVETARLKKQAMKGNKAKMQQCVRYGKLSLQFAVLENDDAVQLGAVHTDGVPVNGRPTLIASVRLLYPGRYSDTVENCIIIATADIGENSEDAAYFYEYVNGQLKEYAEYLQEETDQTFEAVLACDEKATQILLGSIKGNGTYFCSEVSQLSIMNSPLGNSNGRRYKLFKRWRLGEKKIKLKPEILSNNQLKDYLLVRNLDCEGSRNELINRLKNAVKNESISNDALNADWNWMDDEVREILRSNIDEETANGYEGLRKKAISQIKRKRKKQKEQEKAYKHKKKSNQSKNGSSLNPLNPIHVINVDNNDDDENAEEENELITLKELNKMKKAELILFARQQNVDIGGKKVDLVARLRQFCVDQEELPIDEHAIQVTIDKEVTKLRNKLARANGHGISGKKCFYKVKSSSIDPLHGYSIIYKSYLYGVFLFSKRLSKTDSKDGSLSEISLKFLELITKKSSEYTKTCEYLKTEAPKITAKFINSEKPGSSKHEPRLSGKAAKFAASKPDVYLKTLLEAIAIVELGNASKYDDVHKNFNHEQKTIYAYLLLYANLIAEQFRCMTVRLSPPQIPYEVNDNERTSQLYEAACRDHQKQLQDNVDQLERVGYLLSVIENIFLPGITCHYTVQLNCLAHEYAAWFMKEYSCSPGAIGNCQTMERLNSYWKNICAFRRRRGVERVLKNGTKKILLSTHQQRMAKFYFITIYGDVIKPSIPKLKTEKHSIQDGLCSFVLGTGNKKIDTGNLSCTSEIEELELLCSQTLGLYLGEQQDISKDEAIAEFDILIESALYERGAILQKESWESDADDDEEDD
jgi:hypothetical protein